MLVAIIPACLIGLASASHMQTLPAGRAHLARRGNTRGLGPRDDEKVYNLVWHGPDGDVRAATTFDGGVTANHVIEGDIYWSAKIMIKESRRCLSMADGAANAAFVTYEDCNVGTRWRKEGEHLVAVDDGGNYIGGHLCLDMIEDRPEWAPGVSQGWWCTDGNVNQRWELVESQ